MLPRVLQTAMRSRRRTRLRGLPRPTVKEDVMLGYLILVAIFWYFMDTRFHQICITELHVINLRIIATIRQNNLGSDKFIRKQITEWFSTTVRDLRIRNKSKVCHKREDKTPKSHRFQTS